MGWEGIVIMKSSRFLKDHIKLWDIIIITISMGVSIITYSYFLIQDTSEERELVVQISGKTVLQQDIMRVRDDQFVVTIGEDAKAIITVKNGGVRVEKMDQSICPNQICSKMGWIQYQYQSIVCLPNKMVVTLQEYSSKLDVDEISM